jgi:hypothetical protein
MISGRSCAIQNTVSHYSPVIITPFVDQIHHAGVQKKRLPPLEPPHTRKFSARQCAGLHNWAPFFVNLRRRDRDHDVSILIVPRRRFALFSGRRREEIGAQDEVPTRSSPEGAKQIAHASQLPMWSLASFTSIANYSRVGTHTTVIMAAGACGGSPAPFTTTF